MLYPWCQILLQGEPHPGHAEKAWSTGMQNPASGEIHTQSSAERASTLWTLARFCWKSPSVNDNKKMKIGWHPKKNLADNFLSCHVFCGKRVSSFKLGGRKKNLISSYEQQGIHSPEGRGVYTTKPLPHLALTGLCRDTSNPSTLQSTF